MGYVPRMYLTLGHLLGCLHLSMACRSIPRSCMIPSAFGGRSMVSTPYHIQETDRSCPWSSSLDPSGRPESYMSLHRPWIRLPIKATLNRLKPADLCSGISSSQTCSLRFQSPSELPKRNTLHLCRMQRQIMYLCQSLPLQLRTHHSQTCQ